MKQSKCFGWRWHTRHGQVRMICKSPSRAAIERVLGSKISPNNDCFCETGNVVECNVLNSHADMQIFWSPLNGNDFSPHTEAA